MLEFPEKKASPTPLKFSCRQARLGMVKFRQHPDKFMPRVAITVSGKNSQPYRFQLDRKKVTIGRSSESDIIIDCPSVSSLHCTMERVGGGYILRDRHSTNGLKLEDEEMAVIDLRNDSAVRVGDVKFDYTLSDQELDELDDEEFTPHAKKASKVDEEPAIDKKPKVKANVVTTPARSTSPRPPAVLASTNQGGGGLFTFAIFVCGILAFVAGLGNSYSRDQRKDGREGEVSLLMDIKDGRPELPDAGKSE
jgi:pSer/pThr/pTyr-binding forkhead associated (FHA) protein